MLISGVSDETADSRVDPGPEEVPGQQEYQTASELFDLITQNQSFDDGDTLTTQDLVLLYQNLDIGTKLMSSANDRMKPHNQHVETVVYNGDSDTDSEGSLEEINNVFEINQERLNIFANGSLDNILCHKFGGLQIKTSAPTTEYDRQFLFKDPYIMEQLKGLGNIGDPQSQIPTSLLDYICCKRLEDNYNFYLDNIIRYVQRTIDQLKRISNGDYLTERAKEKWKEINGNANENNKTKVLANSTSIPLHVECKKKGNVTWDDIIHSEVDVRSLSKILEKKIVVEIPKLICGSYRVFSKRCADNLIISCKRETEKKNTKEKESRVDVVLQLKKSETGQVMSNISSIMIFQTSPATQEMFTPHPREILPLTYKEQQDIKSCNATTNVETMKPTDDVTESYTEFSYEDDSQTPLVTLSENIEHEEEKSEEISDHSSSEECIASIESSFDPYHKYSSETSIHTNELTENPPLEHNEAAMLSRVELCMAIQRLNMQTVLSEESGEESTNHYITRKSSTKVRIKSPYENKSFMMEERKRKKLLEIRQKRERKKQALGEDCKISKNKYIKGNQAQPANSVTKLSITNKSFYNSIYGQNLNVENNSNKTKSKRINNNIKKDLLTLEVPLERIQDENETPNLTPDKDNKKYINRSYYLDEAETEMMYIQQKQDENKETKIGSASTSASNDIYSKISILTDLISPPDTNVVKVKSITTYRESHNKTDEKKIILNEHPDLKPSKIINPEKTVIENPGNSNKEKSVTSTVACRKSIEKLYNLMKKLSKTNADFKISSNDVDSLSQGSDSGTSLKHQLTSSNTSSFIFDKLAYQKLKTSNKKSGKSAAVVPKVIINSKIQGSRPGTGKDRKKPSSPKPRGDHPIKNIARLLIDLEKPKHKSTPDKNFKKVDVIPNDPKILNRGTKEVTFRGKSRIDQLVNTIKDNEQDRNKVLMPREKKIKPCPPEIAKIPHQQIPIDEKLIESITQNKITEIIDEAKEARGEAVRGPPKFPSRLYTLAQPKKSYVQAHNEEYRTRIYGRNTMMADRLQRLASTSPAAVDRNVRSRSPALRAKPKRAGPEGGGNAKMSIPVLTADKFPRHPPNSNSPKSKSPARSTINNQRNATESPDRRKKNSAVESYVMNHYSRSRSPPTNELRRFGHKSRVPLIPNDIELSSTSYPHTEEAKELGNKLHSIINSICISSSPLEDVTECRESNTELLSVKGNRTDSDFNIDVLEDKYLETAVETCFVSKVANINVTTDKEPNDGLALLSSKTELEKLENALYSHISGTFQKRLRIKNLTLTPKQSLQKVYLLQSGDAGSLTLKSLTKLNINKCVADGNDLKAMPVISTRPFNWNFMEIPMQISTVGYALSQQEATKSNMYSFGDKETATHKPDINQCQSLKVVKTRLGVTEETYVEGHATIVNAAIGTDVEMNKERKVNKIKDKATLENSRKSLLQATETPKNLGNKLLKVSDKSTDPDYTSSLDMLAGLLNEIKKITCENHVNSGCSDLDTMLCNAADSESLNKDHVVSVASLDQVKNLGTNASIYSLYISNADDLTASNCSPNICSEIQINMGKPVYVDKDVNVNIKKDFVSAYTEVPSTVFPITMNNSTNMTNSLVGVISEPSSQSMYTFSEYHTIYSNKVFDTRSTKILEQIPNSDVLDDSPKFTLANFNSNKSSTNAIKNAITLPVRDNKLTKYDPSFVEFDPLLKVKRDILVTLYSILVFTVFAALSFPEITNGCLI